MWLLTYWSLASKLGGKALSKRLCDCLSLSVCLSVCLSVSRLLGQVGDEFY